MVTDVRFLGSSNRLLSCSKDTFVKVWDLDTQHCVQTLVGHRTEVWSFDVHPTEPVLVTAAADSKLRVWRAVRSGDSIPAAPAAPAAATPATEGEEQEQRTEWIEAGEFDRQSKERVVSLRFHHSGRVLACHTADRTVEFFRINDPKEVKKRQKKRVRKAQKNAEEGTTVDAKTVVAADEFSTLGVLRESHKIKAFAFGEADWQILLSLSNNTLATYHLDKAKLKRSNPNLFKKQVAIALPGHRSDVRALALSSDDQLLASGSSGTHFVAGASLTPLQRRSSCGMRALTSACAPWSPVTFSLCSSFPATSTFSPAPRRADWNCSMSQPESSSSR